MTTDLFIPPAAEGLPLAALDSATNGADRLDAAALTPTGRNFLAHALVQLARDGWLRTEPDGGFEPMRDQATPEPDEQPAPTPVSPPPATDRAGLRDRIRRAVCEAEGFAWDSDMLEPDEYGEVADMVLAVLPTGDPAASYRQSADAIERMQGYPHLILPEEIVEGLRLLAAGMQPEPGSPAYTRRLAAGERDEQQAQQGGAETRGPWGTVPGCACPHPADEHSIYGCADGCGCAWMPKRKPMDPVHILGVEAEPTPVAASTPRANETGGTVAEKRPRCPHCQMPHDLTPGSMGVRVCESIRRRIAEGVQRHGEGDHGMCCRADCDVLRQRDAAAPVAGQPPADTGEEAREETVHARPGPDDNGISPCCGRPPFEFRGERLTRDPAAVTCPTSPAVVAELGKEA